MLVVFVGILPRVVDYDAVRAAMASLSTAQLAALVVATAIAYVANAVPSRILIPALGWRRAVGADLAARAVVSTIPGPTDVATRFVLYRQWGIPDDAATAGIVFAAFFETGSALVLPLIATLVVVVTGSTTQPAVIWLSIIGVGVLAISVGLMRGPRPLRVPRPPVRGVARTGRDATLAAVPTNAASRHRQERHRRA